MTNPFLTAGRLAKTAGIDLSSGAQQAGIDQRSRQDILNMGLAALGAGAGARGLVGLWNLAKRRLNPHPARYPAAVMSELPYPVESEKAAEAKPLWYYPGMMAAGGLAAYGGWKGVDALLENRRQKEQEDEVGNAKQDFEHALLDSYTRPKLASERTVGHEIGEMLDTVFDQLQKQGFDFTSGQDWKDLGQNAAGGYMGFYALPTAAIAGALTYAAGQKNSNRSILDKAMKRRQQRSYLSRPSEILAVPRPVPVRGGEPEPGEEAEPDNTYGGGESAASEAPLRRRLDLSM